MGGPNSYPAPEESKAVVPDENQTQAPAEEPQPEVAQPEVTAEPAAVPAATSVPTDAEGTE